jgi:formylmethanofuran dehydrogenase subunit E
VQTFAPRRAGNFKKVQLPARAPSRLIPLEGLGETCDPTLAFVDEDARRRAELDAAIAAEEAAKNRGKGRKTITIKCKQCGDEFVAHNARRDTCGPCSAAGRNHYEVTITRAPNRKRRSPDEVAAC